MLSTVGVGEVIGGRYQIVRLIGQGGMGAVYEAHHMRIDRAVAIKFIHAGMGADVAERFLKEAQITASLQHPGIVQIFDSDLMPDGSPYIVMELLRGDSLAGLLRRMGRLPIPQAVSIAGEAASALQAAHSIGVIHRDIKPDNIFLEPAPRSPLGRQVKILDFGIAKAFREHQGAVTRTGALLGTPAYLAPEQARGLTTVDGRADIYALGGVLFEMLCGQAPFAGRDAMQLMFAHVSEQPPVPSSLNPAVPAKLDKVVLGLLAKAPDDRPPSMAEVVTQLRPFAAGIEPLPPVATSPAPTVSGSSVPRADPAVTTRMTPAVTTRVTEGSVAGNVNRIPVSVPPLRPSSVSAPLSGGPLHATQPSSGPPESLVPFFRALCEDFAFLTPGLMSLTGVKLSQGRDHDFFALFIDDAGTLGAAAPLGHLATRIFVDRAADLRRHLASLNGARRKVVLVIAQAGDLGAGVRDEILDYRQRFDAIVVPLYAGEIEQWTRDRSVADMFEQRLESLHTLPDPYAQRRTSSDPTQFVEMNGDLANLIEQIREGGLVNITGQPGCGKSALVRMAEYGCRDRKFIYMNAGEASHRNPSEMAAELMAAVGQEAPPRNTSPRPGDPSDGAMASQTTSPGAEPMRPVAVGKAPVMRTLITSIGPPLQRAPDVATRARVLVIEDADWLVELLHVPDDRQEERMAARTFWSALGEVAHKGSLTILVTTVRGFELEEGVVDGWTNPVKPRSLSLRPLERRALRSLIVTLGRGINLHYQVQALELIARLTAGNIHVTRKLCSTIVSDYRATQGHHALDQHTVSVTEVRTAARSLVAMQAFGDWFLRWCNEVEREVLLFAANTRPRTLHSLRRALEGRRSASAIASAVKSVQNMKLMTFVGGRHRVAVPLTEDWIREHLDFSLQQRLRRRNRRLNQIAVGLFGTTLLAATYYAWFSPRRLQTTVRTVGACTYSADYPEIGAANREVIVHLFRDCTSKPYPDIRLDAVRAPVQIHQTACPADDGACLSEATIKLLDTAASAYTFQVAVGGQVPLSFKITKDPMALFRDTATRTLQVAAFLPALLSLLVAFKRELWQGLRNLVGLKLVEAEDGITEPGHES